MKRGPVGWAWHMFSCWDCKPEIFFLESNPVGSLCERVKYKLFIFCSLSTIPSKPGFAEVNRTHSYCNSALCSILNWKITAFKQVCLQLGLEVAWMVVKTLSTRNQPSIPHGLTSCGLSKFFTFIVLNFISCEKIVIWVCARKNSSGKSNGQHAIISWLGNALNIGKHQLENCNPWRSKGTFSEEQGYREWVKSFNCCLRGWDQKWQHSCGMERCINPWKLVSFFFYFMEVGL